MQSQKIAEAPKSPARRKKGSSQSEDQALDLELSKKTKEYKFQGFETCAKLLRSKSSSDLVDGARMLAEYASHGEKEATEMVVYDSGSLMRKLWTFATTSNDQDVSIAAISAVHFGTASKLAAEELVSQKSLIPDLLTLLKTYNVEVQVATIMIIANCSLHLPDCCARVASSPLLPAMMRHLTSGNPKVVAVVFIALCTLCNDENAFRQMETSLSGLKNVVEVINNASMGVEVKVLACRFVELSCKSARIQSEYIRYKLMDAFIPLISLSDDSLTGASFLAIAALTRGSGQGATTNTSNIPRDLTLSLNSYLLNQLKRKELDAKACISALVVMVNMCSDVHGVTLIAHTCMESLVTALKVDDQDVVRAALSALQNVAAAVNYDMNDNVLWKFDLLKPLMHLLRVHDDAIVEMSSRVLYVCTHNEAAQFGEPIKEKKVMDAIVRQLGSDNQKTKAFMVSIVGRCAHDEDARRILRKSGALERVCGIIATEVEKEPSTNEEERGDSDAMQMYGALAVMNCALSPDCAADALKFGVVPPITKMMSSTNVQLATSSTGAVRNLSQAAPVAVAFVDGNAVPVLIKHLLSRDEDLRSYAAGALGNIALHEDRLRKVIQEANAVGALVSMVILPSQKSQPFASMAVMNMAKNKDAAEEIVRRNGIKALCRAMDSKNSEVQMCAAGAIRNCASFVSNLKEAVEREGGMEKLELLRSSTNPNTSQTASAALEILNNPASR